MDLEPFLRMCFAAALVVPVGLERELRGKPAGLRTHVVVGTASAALGYVSILAAPDGAMGTDQTRIAAQVVSGIGFMGAGVIFAAGGRVHGLTTAAALWGASAIGLCVGLGESGLALALVTVVMLFLWPVDWLSDRLLIRVKREERTYQVLTRDVDGLRQVQRLLASRGHRAMEFQIRSFEGGVSIHLVMRTSVPEALEVLRDLRALDGVEFVTDEALSDPEG